MSPKNTKGTAGDTKKPSTQQEESPVFAMIDGRIIERKEGIVRVEVFSGLQIDISEGGIDEVREYVDPITGQAIVQLVVNEDASINAKIVPRLIRQAQGSKKIPFGFRTMLEGKQNLEMLKIKPDQAATKEMIAASQTRSIFQTDTWCTILTAHLLDDSHGDINSIDD